MTRAPGRTNRTILTALVLFTLFFRLLTLMMPHTGVDERDYWSAGKALVSEAPYPEVHHRTVRWPIILPVALTQLLFGTHPNVYYVVPVLVSCLIVGFFYTTGRRIDPGLGRPTTAPGGHLTGFLAALGFALFPYMIRAGSQIRPAIFGVLFMLLTIRFLAAHADSAPGGAGAPGRSGPLLGLDRNLLLAAGALFLAYLTKITNVFFVPGVLIYLWVRPRLIDGAGDADGQNRSSGFREALIVGLLLFGLFLLETLLYGVFRGQWLGRAGIILNNHLTQDFAPLPSFWALFRRYSSDYLPAYWSVPLALFPVAAAYLWKKGRRLTAALFVLPVLSFLIPFTFAVSSLDPVVPAERFIHRYFMPVLPFVLLLDVLAFTTLLTGFAQSPRAPKRLLALARRLPPGAASVVLLGVMLLGIAGVFAGGMLPESLGRYYTSPLNLSEHPLALNTRYLRQLNAAYTAGTPMVARPHTGGTNALASVARYYLLPGIIGSGPYPEPEEASFNGGSGGGQFRYLSLGSLPNLTPTTPVILVERNPFRPQPMTLEQALAAMQRPEGEEN